MRFIYVLLANVIFSVACFGQQVQQRPNILWIVSEDTSPLLGCYGDKFATTPNIDQLAKEGVLYSNAFSAGPACALSRTSLITGMLGSTMGTDNMRSDYPTPAFIKFFPRYLRDAGYYTTNCAKKDYNTVDQKNTWDASGPNATYKNRKPGQPFFAVFNLGSTHESKIHRKVAKLKHDPEKVQLPPYNPPTPEIKYDWALMYDNIERMDGQVGKLLKELEESGEAQNTIVFYYSDHGGVVARSKRYMFDSGLKVPLVIKFPAKFGALTPAKSGTAVDRVVSFDDFAPTVLSLIGVKIPSYMQGKAFLGNQASTEKEFAFAYRGRIDEREDFVRSIRSKQYRYVRNYLPQKVYGQHVEYQWQARSIVSFEDWYKKGKTNAIQSAFWQPRPAEELYDVVADPANVNNLAGKKEYQQVLQKMRNQMEEKMLADEDTGFIPEAMKAAISDTGIIYNYAHSEKYPLKKIMQTADVATSRDKTGLPLISNRLKDSNPLIKYWAAMGCAILGKQAAAAQPALKALLTDKEPLVAVEACSALYATGYKGQLNPVLENALKSNNKFLRLKALSVLDEMGKDAAFAVPAIKTLIANATPNRKAGDNLWDFGQDVALASQILRKF